MEQEKSIEDFEKHLANLRDIIDFHVLSAAKFCNEIHVIEGMIKKMKGNKK